MFPYTARVKFFDLNAMSEWLAKGNIKGQCVSRPIDHKDGVEFEFEN